MHDESYVYGEQYILFMAMRPLTLVYKTGPRAMANRPVICNVISVNDRNGDAPVRRCVANIYDNLN